MSGENEILKHAVSNDEMESNIEQPEWVVVKSLLDVENTCTDTMEEFLLHTTTDATDDLPTAELQARLDELIAKQERVVAELELAKRALTDLDAE